MIHRTTEKIKYFNTNIIFGYIKYASQCAQKASQANPIDKKIQVVLTVF